MTTVSGPIARLIGTKALRATHRVARRMSRARPRARFPKPLRVTHSARRSYDAEDGVELLLEELLLAELLGLLSERESVR